VGESAHPLFRDAPTSVEFGKLRKRLIRELRETLAAYAMVRPGAKWLVCLSGGKDSWTLLALLVDLKWRGLLPVELLACNLDQAQPAFPADVLPDFLARHAIPYRIERRDTYSVVKRLVPEGRTYCPLCSRLRRGNLYRVAREEGCEAVVLGHHREDVLETFLMNLIHGGRLATMPPKLLNEDGDLLVLRPLAACAEGDIARFASAMRFPIIPCDLCGAQEGLERARIKTMLDDWEKQRPGTKTNMLRALANARPSHLLDPALFDFSSLNADAQKFDPEVERC
jgi:tRNA 2-thiocytidine biosynthesis protein TtcA